MCVPIILDVLGYDLYYLSPRPAVLRAVDGVVLQAVRPVHRRPALRLRASQVYRTLQELYCESYVYLLRWFSVSELLLALTYTEGFSIRCTFYLYCRLDGT